MNVFAYHSPAEGYVTIILPRAEHRPACYYACDETQRLISPGALDMSGLMVTPRECDFESVTADEAASFLREVALPQATVDVIAAELNALYEKN